MNNFFCMIDHDNPAGFKFFRHDAEHSMDAGWEDRTAPANDKKFRELQKTMPAGTQLSHKLHTVVPDPFFETRLLDELVPVQKIQGSGFLSLYGVKYVNGEICLCLPHHSCKTSQILLLV